jgi:hypothetical protein
MAEGFLIRTPTDFGRALDSAVSDDVKVPLVSPPPVRVSLERNVP